MVYTRQEYTKLIEFCCAAIDETTRLVNTTLTSEPKPVRKGGEEAMNMHNLQKTPTSAWGKEE